MMLSATLTPLPSSLKRLEIYGWYLSDRKTLLFDRAVVLSQLHRTQCAKKAQRKLYVALGSLINGVTPAE